MDLAYVDKLAKDNDGLKYLLVGQDLFDRTVNAKGMKTKDSQESESLFIHDYKKEPTKKDLGWQGNRLLERLKSFVLLTGYKFTLLWVTLRQLLLNVQYDHWKIFFTVTWKIMGTSTYTKYLNLSPT